jgi:hypothetical protein
MAEINKSFSIIDEAKGYGKDFDLFPSDCKISSICLPLFDTFRPIYSPYIHPQIGVNSRAALQSGR